VVQCFSTQASALLDKCAPLIVSCSTHNDKSLKRGATVLVDIMAAVGLPPIAGVERYDQPTDMVSLGINVPTDLMLDFV